MANYKKIKGNKGENEVFDLFDGDGLDVQAVQASGAIKREQGDIILRYLGKKYNMEVKLEKTIPIKGLETRKAESDILVMRQDRDKWKVYMDLDTLMMLLLNNRT